MKTRPRLIPTEHQEQVAFVQWCEVQALRDSRYRMLFAIPNGGARAKVTAARLKAEGVCAGVPDLFLAVASCGLHGLFIEMKRIDASPSDTKPAQREWIEKLTGQGYGVRVCKGADEAMAAAAAYMAGKV